MAEKTCFLKMRRWIPKSTELVQAFQTDGALRVDLTPTADPGDVSIPIAELNDAPDEVPEYDETPAEEPPAQDDGEGRA